MNASSNCTETACRTAKLARKEDIDALLAVVPYYNKPNQAGIYEHFSQLAKSTDLPIILYNIPSRTGVNMLPETVAKLANKYSNIDSEELPVESMGLIQCHAYSVLKVEEIETESGDEKLVNLRKNIKLAVL